MMILVIKINFNALTTNNVFWRHLSLAACHQLAQFILKIDFALARKVGLGEVGGHNQDIPCTWHLL